MNHPELEVDRSLKMNFSHALDPDQELFRSLLMNDLHDISTILPNIKSIYLLKCAHCDDTFNDIYVKEDHEKAHLNQFQCRKCFAVFSSKVSLGAHVFRNHIDKQKKEILSKDKIKKEKVQSVKRESEDLQRPRDANVKTEMMTEITRKDPNIRSRLLKMMSMKGGLWVCHQCGAEKKDKGHAFDHVETHVDYLVYPCKNPGCSRTFNAWVKLRSHNKINGGCSWRGGR